MDAIRFNVENITNKEEIAILTRLAVLNELSNKLILISRIFDICGNSIDVRFVKEKLLEMGAVEDER